jgi:MFS family permease
MVLQVSQIIGFWVNYGVNEHISVSSDAQWRIPFGLQLIPGTLLVVLMLLQPESPRWLIKNGQRAKAINNLSFIRKLAAEDAYTQWEADTIEEQLRHEAEAGDSQPFFVKIKEVFLPGNRYRLFLGMSLMMLQNLSGINALNYYSPTIFKSIGFSGTSVGLLATGVFGIVKCTATILFMVLGIDHLGRRKSMIIGSSGAIVAMYYLAGYTKLSRSFETTASRDAGAYIAIVMVYIFAVFYAISWNGIPWVFWYKFPCGR